MTTVDTNDTLEAAERLNVRSLCEAFQNTASEAPDQVALRNAGGAVEITWGEYADRVRSIATGLASLGVTAGDTVGIMLVNRPEFALVDNAALHLGATPFSIYNTSSPEQIAYLFGNAGNRIVITEQAFLPTLRAAGTDVETYVVIDGEAEGAISLEGLEQRQLDGFDFDDLARGRARHRRDADLHLRHHRSAEGSRADPRRHARPAPDDQRRHPAPAR